MVKQLRILAEWGVHISFSPPPPPPPPPPPAKAFALPLEAWLWCWHWRGNVGIRRLFLSETLKVAPSEVTWCRSGRLHTFSDICKVLLVDNKVLLFFKLFLLVVYQKPSLSFQSCCFGGVTEWLECRRTRPDFLQTMTQTMYLRFFAYAISQVQVHQWLPCWPGHRLFMTNFLAAVGMLTVTSPVTWSTDLDSSRVFSSGISI